MLMVQVCTSSVACFCADGFAGRECSEKSNVTLIRLTTMSMQPASTLAPDPMSNITHALLNVAPGDTVTPLPRIPLATGVLG